MGDWMDTQATRTPKSASMPSLRLRSRGAIHEFRLRLSDLACVSWAVVGAQVARFGSGDDSLRVTGSVEAPYTVVTVVLIVGWWLALGAWGARDQNVLGHGPEEYKRIVTASLWLFGAIAIGSYVLQLDTARGYVAVALPLGVCALLISRWVLRKLLVRARIDGLHVRRVLLLGAPESAAHLSKQLVRNPSAGYVPVAAYLPGSTGTRLHETNLRVPVIGHSEALEAIIAAVEESGVDTVAISGSSLPPSVLRRLGWHLASLNVSMVMVPALTDVAGPRIHTQPVGGLPLIHVTTPKLEGGKGALKRSLDVVSALVLLALLAIPMLIVATAVKIDSPGPALFRQTRIGRAGHPFMMFKFRSMVVNAEERLKELQATNEGAGLLFKMKRDPRVTRLGAFIRRFSIDELPQLFNVIRGEMSLVGPRPPLPSEVAGYDDYAHRRLLVKPGVTGLWQVSGRSDLSWEDTIRLDLYYVENWSIIQDFIIVLRTVRAVVAKKGAY